MSKNLAQIVDAIQQWIGVDEEDSAERLPDAVCIDLVNWVIKDYCRKRESRFGETSTTFPTVASQKAYSLPARWSKPGQIWYLDPDTSSPVFLEYIASKSSFDSKYPDATIKDDPVSYTIWAQQILLGKTPDRILALNCDYWSLPADLSGSQTNTFTEAAEQYIIFKALSSASLFGIEDERMPTWETAAKRLETALDSEDSRALTTARRSQSQYPG